MIWWNSVFWIRHKFVGDYYVSKDADICLFEYYLQSCTERYLCQWNYHYCYKKKSFLFFLPTAWLTSLLSCICSYLEAIFQISIFNPSQKLFSQFSFCRSAKNDTSWQKQRNFQVMFVFLFLLIPWWYLCCSPACWSLCSHRWGCVYRTVEEVKGMCFSVVPGDPVCAGLGILCNHTASQGRANRGRTTRTLRMSGKSHPSTQ